MIAGFLLCIVAALCWLLWDVQRQAIAERAAMQLRHLEYCQQLQADIRNLTASIVRSEGRPFILPAETKPTEQWFTAKPVIMPAKTE